MRYNFGIKSCFMTFDDYAERRCSDENADSDYRQPFSLDADRILNSLSYSRYIDKTQVFYLVQNDHVTHRVLHVQLVSKIARTIGRHLGLNEDLIEAIALGHDIGHVPFGHDGEKILSELCVKNNIGRFHHNVQSVQFLDKVEKKGKGLNLCLQTLDGILCHDGEVHNQILKPIKSKTFDTLEIQILLKRFESGIDKYTNEPKFANLIPMTLEGCVVRMADTISYIGRDIEDAIRLNIIERNDIPEEVSDILGNTNGTIVYKLVNDVIENSYCKDMITFSEDISNVLKILKNFNYQRIYLNDKVKKHQKVIENMFSILFEEYFNDLENCKYDSVIFRDFLDDMDGSYKQNYNNAEIVRDFIAGMTDSYFLNQFPESKRPKMIVFD